MTKNKQLKNSIIFLLLLILYYFLNQFFSFSIPCPIHYLTNYYCPGCGITRMFFSLFKGHFYQAFRFNPLVFILLIIYIFIKIKDLVLKKKTFFSNKTIYFLLIVVIAFGILRNIPYFSYLLPTLIE